MIENLAVLPSSYLSHSVITTVWVGIMVIAFFNLRFGWIFTGLVVPGYLTPLLLIKPLSVVIIMGESVLTYWLIYLISEVAAKRGLWTNFFGRDRFFALLLGSVMVRLFIDGWALPWLNHYSVSHFQVNLNAQDSLHSFGLIIVALIANHLWKPRVLSGLFQLAVTIGITYVIIRYIFIPYSNFSLSNIGYLYEDIAGSILASPKSYIILIVTAFIASRMNLFYGWEFNGILVPSLLALQWYQPSKILISFMEAYIILFLALLILKLPILRDMSIEGARKTVLFFNIGFFYKIFLSIIIVEFLPDYKISDYFGFGYLLSTLIAVKMFEKVSMPLFTRATLQTSLVSVFIATMIGYALTLIPKGAFFYTPLYPTSQKHLRVDQNESIISYLEKKKVALYRIKNPSLVLRATPKELAEFESSLRLIDEDFFANEKSIREKLHSLHYDVVLIENRYLVLSQSKGFVGWGILSIDLKQDNPLLIEVPYPLEKADIMESAIAIMKLTQAKVLSISGVPLSPNQAHSSQSYHGYYSIYHSIHKHYAHNSVLQVRAKQPHLGKEKHSLLFIKGYMPKHFKLSLLKEILPSLEVSWEDKTEVSIQKQSMYNGFAELYLSQKQRRWLLSSQDFFTKDLREDSSINSIEGLLQKWILEQKIEIARKGSEKYLAPSLAELLFFDNVIFSPIYHLLEKWETRSFDKEAFKKELFALSFASKSLGYQLTLYEDSYQKKHYLILHELTQNKTRYWGTYIFKIGKAENIIIQTPRPFYESHTFEYSLELFSQLNARFLMLSGTHPLSNKDGSADVMRFKNKANLFNLLNQVLYRESGNTPMNALHIRGRQANTLLSTTMATLAFHQVFESLEQLNNQEQYIYHYLNAHLPLAITDGSIDSAGYDAMALQSLYLKQSKNNTFNILWLPSSLRSHYKQVSQNDIKVQHFRSINIAIKEASFIETLPLYRPSLSKHCYKESIDHLLFYLNSRDITEIEALNRKGEVEVTLFIDTHNAQPYILLTLPHTKELLAIAKLNAPSPYNRHIFKHTSQSKDAFKEDLKLFYHHSDSLWQREQICEK